MKKVFDADTALILNYDKLGGAEKSALEQAQVLSKDVDLYYPRVNSDSQILEGVGFKMPSSFFKSSRSGRKNYITASFSFLLWFLCSKKIDFSKYNTIWFNGIKVFVLFSPSILLFHSKKKIYFHLRDYLPNHFIFSLILKLYKLRSVKLSIIGNSIDVVDDFNSKFDRFNFSTQVCYNLCEKLNSHINKKKPVVIATASMLTPWKGVHKVLLFEKLYRKELKDLGIKEVAIFGDEIYKTDNGHVNYKAQLKKITDVESLIKFYGQVSSEEIYKSADILIHSSIEPEPFGRVILEAFSCGIPVLSQGLGGSSELFQDVPELLYLDSDLEGMFIKIKHLIDDDENRNKLQDKLVSIHHKINSQAKIMLEDTFGSQDD